MIKPSNVLKHEIIGLECRVVDAKNKDLVGLKGKIINETMKTIVLSLGKERKSVPKKGTKFRLTIGKQRVDIEGDCLMGRPEQRIKKIQRKW